MTARREEVHTHGSLKTRGMAHHARPHKEAPGMVRRQTGVRGEHGRAFTGDFVGMHGKGGDRLVGIGKLGESWLPLGCRGVPSCLAPGLQWFGAEGILTWCVRCLHVGSGLVGLCTKGMLAGESWLALRISQPWEVAISP